MSNDTIPSPSQILHGEMTQTQFLLSSLTMLTYASLLHFPDEVTYIWGMKSLKFTLPTCFYLLSKYPIFLYQIIYVIEALSSGTSTCILSSVGGAISILPLIGVRGLVAIKTYTLGRESRSLGIAVFVTFLFPVMIALYELTIPHCKPSTSNSSTLSMIIRNAAGVPSDILAFIVVINRVRGLWKLKRDLGLQDNGGLLTSILEQGLGEFCLLLFITPIKLIIALFTPGLFSSSFSAVPNTLSSLLICSSILDLRRWHEEHKLPVDSDQSTLVGSVEVEEKNSVYMSDDPAVLGGIATGLVERQVIFDRVVGDSERGGGYHY